MRLIFWRKDGTRTSKKLEEAERAAVQAHKENIQNIVKSRREAVKLKTVLKQNNITIELAKAIGH